MSGFIRRFSSFPAQDVLTAIEGINIIDLPPPAAVQGLSTNVIACVGEFADMTYAVSVDTSGNITTFIQPQEVFSGQDLLNKVGPFDATLGAFGSDMGSGYVALRNKTFGRLIVVPVNLTSATGIRMWRQLPTCKSATDPTPIVPTLAASVPAAFTFKKTSATIDRINTAARVTFTGIEAYSKGVDGSVTTAAAAATQTFTSAGSFFQSGVRIDGITGVQVGDILVVGVIGGAGALGSNANTYRVVAIPSETTLTVQILDGTNFAFSTGSALPWRLHDGRVADSYGPGSGSLTTSQGSFTVPVRPITNGAGTGSSSVDGTWATAQQLDPVVPAAAGSATTWNPLSGLTGRTGPTTGVAFTAAIQAPNAANSAGIDALYATSFDALLYDSSPASDVSHVFPARTSDTIRLKVKSHVQTASAQGVGRTGSISPGAQQAISTVISTVTGDVSPGVGAYRDERVFYHWPPVKTFIPEAVGISIKRADGSIGTDGIIDTLGSAWMSSVLGNLAPERNPGEFSATTSRVLSPVIGYATNVPPLDINTWEALRRVGISGIRMDRTVGPIFQSGVTTSLLAGQKNINRRKMADYIEDSIGAALKPFAKLPMSNQLQDAVIGEVDDFLTQLLSPDNPSAQRINGYLLDSKSGNTPQSTAAGIFVLVIKVRTTPTADFIVLQFEVGEGVVVTSDVSSAA